MDLGGEGGRQGAEGVYVNLHLLDRSLYTFLTDPFTLFWQITLHLLDTQ